MVEDETKSDGDDGETDAPAFVLSESPAHLLRRTQQLAAEIFANAGLADGVTLRQSVVLAAVAEREGLSQSDLVAATGIDRSTLADMIARMQAKGLVSRRSAIEDARAKSVSLTDQGRDALILAQPALMHVDEALLDKLPRNRRKAFIDLLSRLAGAADGAEVDVSTDDKSGSKKKKKKKSKSKKTKAKKARK